MDICARQARRMHWNSDGWLFTRAQISTLAFLPASPSSPLEMSSFNIPINQADPTAPTPQNTPLTHAPIAQGLSRPTVPDITEDNEGEEEEVPDSIQQAMLGLVHGRLSGLVGKSSGYIESLPVEVKKNVEALKGVQVKQIELQNKYKRECLELEKKVSASAIYLMHREL